MNILAEQLQKFLEEGISDEERALREKEFNDLYYKMRAKEENGFFWKLPLKQKKRLHKLTLPLIKLNNRISGFNIEVLNDLREKTDKPIIFAVTHIGKSDILAVSEVIEEHYYALAGDYEHAQGTSTSIILAINGVIYFNERVKADRAAAVEKMINVLKSGGNIMYFPEGNWNLSPNLPILPCYWGIVDTARKGNAIIVPVAVEQYGKHFKVNIGNNFDMKYFPENTEGKTQAISTLRDTLASLKYEIWESEPRVKRAELVGNEWDNYVNDRFSEWTFINTKPVGSAEWTYLNLKYIDGTLFKPKGVTEPAKAFEHLNHISPNKSNAFLFNKRLK